MARGPVSSHLGGMRASLRHRFVPSQLALEYFPIHFRRPFLSISPFDPPFTLRFGLRMAHFVSLVATYLTGVEVVFNMNLAENVGWCGTRETWNQVCWDFRSMNSAMLSRSTDSSHSSAEGGRFHYTLPSTLRGHKWVLIQPALLAAKDSQNVSRNSDFRPLNPIERIHPNFDLFSLNHRQPSWVRNISLTLTCCTILYRHFPSPLALGWHLCPGWAACVYQRTEIFVRSIRTD